MNDLLKLHNLYNKFTMAVISKDIKSAESIGHEINAIHTKSIIGIAEAVSNLHKETKHDTSSKQTYTHTNS